MESELLPALRLTDSGRNDREMQRVRFSHVTCRWYGREQGGSCGVPTSGGHSLGLSWEVVRQVRLRSVDDHDAVGALRLGAPLLADALQERAAATPERGGGSSSGGGGGGGSGGGSRGKKKNKNARKRAQRMERADEDVALAGVDGAGAPVPRRLYPAHERDGSLKLPKVSAKQRERILLACGGADDRDEQRLLGEIRKSRAESVGCLCVPLRKGGRCCTDSALCQCAAEGIGCHGNACLCLQGPPMHAGKGGGAGKKQRCANPQGGYNYDEQAVNKKRKGKLRQANNGASSVMM